MKHIKILDCTLRDGGYVNDWEFSAECQNDILGSLNKSKIDIVECGFLDPAGDNKTTRFRSINTMNDRIKKATHGESPNSLFVAMIELEKYDSSILPIVNTKDTNTITGIRLTFRKSAKLDFLDTAREIIAKGYKLFVQPISTSSYTDRELLDIIDLIKDLDVYAFYIVDTHGSMDSSDLKRIFTVIDNNLQKTIPIGFHSHNNLQLSYSLACELIGLAGVRSIIIDSSLLGMGRGAGNLNTELICSYINSQHTLPPYDVVPIITTIDEHIAPLKDKFVWGYSVPYYLTATNKCHPNYATYLVDRHVSSPTIDSLLKLIPSEFRLEFEKSAIEILIKNR
jgi:4-hydroxy 2-oxovalerate aldolase